MYGRSVLACVIVLGMILSGITIIPSEVKALEEKTLQYWMFPPAADFINNDDNPSYSYNVGSTYVWFDQIYLNEGTMTVKNLALSYSFDINVAGGGTHYIQFYWRNDVTTNTYVVGGQYSTAATGYSFNPDVTAIYLANGSPAYFSFGYRAFTSGVGNIVTIDWHYARSIVTITYIPESSSTTTIINAINAMSSAMDTRFNSVDSAISGLGSSLSGLTTTVNTINGNVNTLNSKIDIIDTNVDGLVTSVGIINANINAIDNKIDCLTVNVSNINTNLSLVSGNIDYINSTVIDINTKCDNISSNVVNVSNKVTNVSSVLENLSADMLYRYNIMYYHFANISTYLNTLNDDVMARFDNVDYEVNSLAGNLTDFETLMGDDIDDIMDRFDGIDSEIDDLFTFTSDSFNTTYNETALIGIYMNNSFSLLNDSMTNNTNIIISAGNDLYNCSIANMTANQNALMNELGVMFNATFNLTTWTLEGFNGTSEQFDYTCQLINETYSLVNFTYESVWYVGGMVNDTMDMINDTQTDMLEYRNDVVENITDCGNEINITQRDIYRVIDNYNVVLDNVRQGVMDIQIAIEHSKMLGDDGLIYLIRSAPKDTKKDYLFVSNGLSGNGGYYTYSVYNNKLIKFNFVEIDVNYTGLDLKGMWRDVIVVGENGDKKTIVKPEFIVYNPQTDTLSIYTGAQLYERFVLHVHPTFYGRLKVYWNNLWS